MELGGIRIMTSDWQQLDETYIMSTYNRLPIAIEQGVGNYLIDTQGNNYLDLFTGLAVNILGHSHPAIIDTLKEQGEKFLHISNVFLNKPAIELAQRLVHHSIKGKVFFANSGAEATEAAIKLIHKWSKEQKEQKSGVVVLQKSFHGRTLGALKMTRQPGVYQDFPATTLPVFEVEPHDIEALEEIVLKEKPAAVVMEPVLGSGGIVPLEREYLQQVAELCKKYDVLLCMDEIQTGIGRTGRLFAYQHSDITPDILLFAKGVGGGLPLGGIIAGEHLSHLFKPGDHGSTFAPSPLSAALGNTVLRVLLEEGQLEKCQENADYFHEKLAQLKDSHSHLLVDIRGLGMMLGIVTNLSAEQAKVLQKNMLTQGFLIDITQQTIVRLLPPLTIKKEEIDLFLEAFTSQLKLVEKE